MIINLVFISFLIYIIYKGILIQIIDYVCQRKMEEMFGKELGNLREVTNEERAQLGNGKIAIGWMEKQQCKRELKQLFP